MKKRLTSFFIVLVLSFSLSLSAFAVDDNSYYSFSPVTDSSLNSVMSVASTVVGWSDIDHDYLNQIRLALTQSNTGSIRGSIISLLSNSDKILSKLIDIKSSTDYIQNINNNTNSVVSLLRSDLKGSDILSLLQDSNLDKLAKDTTLSNGLLRSDGYSQLGHTNDLLDWLLPRITNYLAFDGNNPDEPYQPTLYHYVKNLSETLASDDDKALAESQKENREQIEKDFVSGSSGKTSLGKGDFSNASQVGGVLNDTFNMGGAAKVSDFLSGFGSAGSESLSWFSQTTSNNLNAVEASDGTQSVSTFSDDADSLIDADPDPYNMTDIFSRYDWLEGVNLDG